MMTRARGFTLIELMIALAIVGILVAVALPSYRQHVVKSNRSAAQAQMMDVANRQQQYLLTNRRYATTLAELGYSLPSEVSGTYSCGTPCIEVNAASVSVPSFTVTFTPIASQTADGAITLNSEGVKAPSAKW